MNIQEDSSVTSYENVGRLVVSTVAYPLENAKILIQIGHEPIKPYATKTILGKPAVGLPNIFKYVKHIYTVDGLKGCYNGFVPWLSTNLLYRYTQKKVGEQFHNLVNENRNEENLTEDERLTLLAGVLYRGVVCRAVAIIVSQPLHVVTVRTVAQFVGNETKYTGVFSALWTILKEEGIFGLFSGLLPRLLADIFVFTLATTGCFLIRQYVVRDKEGRKFADPIMQYVASASCYSFNVVGTCMAVTNCGLTAGSPPSMPHYHHMFDCWSHLQNINQLKRGSSVMWRYYTPVSKELLYNKR